MDTKIFKIGLSAFLMILLIIIFHKFNKYLLLYIKDV